MVNMVQTTESLWSKSVTIEPRAPLHGDIEADVAVIGAGLAGVLTAFFLQQKGLHTVVLEAARIGSGQTQNTTAKITTQHGLMYSKLIKDFGMEKARQYAMANQRAIAAFEELINGLHIQCEFEHRASYLYSVSNEQALLDEARAASELGLDAQYVTRLDLPIKTLGAVRFANQAQFHPLRFLRAVAEKLTIYEQTQVTDIKEHSLLCENGSVHAKHIVMATHYPFLNTPGFYFMRMHQERSYAIALENVPLPEGMYYGIDAGTLSLRSSGSTLIVGGGNHRTGEAHLKNQYDLLRTEARRWYPGGIEIAAWSAQDCIPMDGVPYIGRFSAATPDWYVATGFKKWGMTSSMAAARLLSDAVTGRDNPYAEVFSPQRFVLSASAKQLAEDGAQSAKGLAAEFLSIPATHTSALPNGHGGIVEYKGHKMGVYKDENGQVHVVSTRCPHLGCQLEWNPAERSWDCPCHGSRFDYTGKLIDNPALGGLKHE